MLSEDKGMNIQRLSVVGIGKLGLCVAAIFASKGYTVMGIDVNVNTVAAVNEGKCPIYEPGLSELMRKCNGRLSATSNYEYGIGNSDATFIVVPTPSQDDGSFSTKFVEDAIRNIAPVLRSKQNFHLVVVNSTVLPGDTDNIVKPLLEQLSGKKCGVDFGLCYNPEFIALGNVIHGLMSPDMLLIGESDAKSGQILIEIYNTTCQNHPYIARMSPYNAELAKIALNAYITMKISFANILAEICERIPDGNVDLVTRAIGADSRIGTKYLSGGVSYGGPCFPRDNKAFASCLRKFGCQAKLAQTTDEVNKEQDIRIVQMVKQKLNKIEGANVSILGLTYKPDTDVIEVSAPVSIARALSEYGVKVKVYDPAGMKNAENLLGKSVEYSNSIDECLRGSDFCILATPWSEFKSLKPVDFISRMKRPILLDCWRIFNQADFNKGMEYLAIGLNKPLA